MLFYMQMKNWFMIFMMLTMTYMVHQKLKDNRAQLSHTQFAKAASFSIFR